MRTRVLIAGVVLVAALVTAVAASPAAAVSTDALRVTTPRPYQVVQRGPAGTADLLVKGVAHGVGTRVQVRWAGGAWVGGRVAANGSFKVVLRRRAAGQGTLVVRSVSDPSISRSVRFVGVGDIYVIAGQSNASGRGISESRSLHATMRAGLFGNDDAWRELRDPVDSPVKQVDRVSRDSFAHGSVWPFVATGLMTAEPVPVAFVPCAKSTTSIYQWLPDRVRPFSRTTLYGSLVRRARAVGGVRAVLFWQGEADARALVPQADYEEALRTLAESLADDLGVPLVAAQIGDYDVRYTAAGVNGIRLAQQDVWGHGDVVAGPVLYDIDLHGRVHFTQRSELEAAALRWTAAVLAGVGRLDVPVGPRLLEATYDEWLTVGLTFDVADGGLRPGRVGGLTLRSADGDPVAYQYAAVAGPDSVSVYLYSPVTEPLVVSLGSGRDAAGEDVPVEASEWALPALPFVGVGVAAAGPDDELRAAATVASTPPLSPR
jgi:hypothetical protein